ncbi:hypothetical protein [Streptomyces sp. NBC_01361]|uniref:hypothetical protein n=1 Tax=Streptomyces sp. NBC_01361 TaxID=2903838 RepID=UPI002E35D29A|nr:hypothetical protein [Streptomyces sp. NBC_01361]
MRIAISVDQPTPEFQEKLLALLAEHAHGVAIDTTWTDERATHYYRMLSQRARRIVKEAVQCGGHVPADALCDKPDDSLHGDSASLSRILQRGRILDRWPKAIDRPVKPVGPGFIRQSDWTDIAAATGHYRPRHCTSRSRSLRTHQPMAQPVLAPHRTASTARRGRLKDTRYAPGRWGSGDQPGRGAHPDRPHGRRRTSMASTPPPTPYVHGQDPTEGHAHDTVTSPPRCPPAADHDQAAGQLRRTRPPA